jgi:AcrR family transcriptional regulator
MAVAIPLLAQSGKRARTRDQLLVAAQTLLLNHSAASLGIRQITAEAGMVHASFYNYYASVEALIEDLGSLLLTAHAMVIARLRASTANVAETFALTTRQTLRFVLASPDYGRLVFDAGLPVDRFISGLRVPLAADIARGIASGAFRSAHPDIAVSVIAGSLLGLSLDLHRGLLPPEAIEAVTADLLVMLGVPEDAATRIATEKAAFLPAPKLPLRWQALDMAS